MAIIGVAQVIAGVVLAIGSVGFASEFGISLAVGGIGDIVRGVQHAFKGKNFDMEKWATGKGIDLAVSLVMAGVSSKVGSGKKLAEGSKILMTTEKLRHVGFEIGKRLATTELVKFASKGVERMAARPIKGA